MLVSNVLAQIINSWPNKKLLDYGYLEQPKDISPGIVGGFSFGIVRVFDGCGEKKKSKESKEEVENPCIRISIVGEKLGSYSICISRHCHGN